MCVYIQESTANAKCTGSYHTMRMFMFKWQPRITINNKLTNSTGIVAAHDSEGVHTQQSRQ